MENIVFGKKGLLVGIIAYPFDCSGEDFFKCEFKEGLFGMYKGTVAESFGGHQKTEYEETSVYEPKGYNLFGGYNLAVLSLIDGYALGNRVFHMGHGNQGADVEHTNYRYQVLTGVGCSICEGEDYLDKKAHDTFLREDDRFPYIAVTRLKLNDALLLGTGVELLQAVRIKVEKFLGGNINAFTIDTFGNSEIVLLSFADSLTKLSDLVLKVKNLTVCELDSPCVTHSWLAGKGNIGTFHVFAGSYTHLGYNLEWRGEKFLPIAAEEKELQMQFRWELKPGHEEVLDYIKGAYNKCLENFIEKKGDDYDSVKSAELKRRWEERNWIYNIDSIMCHLAGANICYSRVKFNLDNYCRFLDVFRNKQTTGENNPEIPESSESSGNRGLSESFKKIKQLNIGKHIRSLKVQLFFAKEIEGCEGDTHEDVKLDLEKFKFSPGELDLFRSQLRSCGLSKLTRERMMKLFARFNEYIGNRQVYFIELREFLSEVMRTIREFEKDERMDIGEVDNYLTHVIQAFDGAFFNRYHQSVGVGAQNDIALEYNGGIQQYVSSFTLCFQEALKILDNVPDVAVKGTAEAALLYISGYESVKSQREIMRINMNLITYPELFAISIYKEAGNFIAGRTRRREGLKSRDAGLMASVMWHDSLTMEKIPDNLRSLVRKSDIYRSECPAHRLLAESLNTKLAEYFIADIHNLYFGFNGDIELLYYSYWKYFLQISSSYQRNGEMKTESFVSSLLRLFVVLFYHSKDDSDEEQRILDRWKKQAFDPRLSSLWKVHFSGVLEMAKVIWKGLKQEGFLDFITYEVFWKTCSVAGEGYLSYKRLEEAARNKGNNEPIVPVWLMSHKELAEYEKSLSGIDSGDQKARYETITDAIERVGDLFAFLKEIRQHRIGRLEQKIEKYELLEKEEDEVLPELFLSDVLLAYLNVLRKLDEKGVLKSLLRDEKGKPHGCYEKGCDAAKLEGIKKLNPHFSPLLSDPQGGMFTHGLNERLSYFGFRTVLYKSLWNYSMKRKKEDILSVTGHA